MIGVLLFGVHRDVRTHIIKWLPRCRGKVERIYSDEDFRGSAQVFARHVLAAAHCRPDMIGMIVVVPKEHAEALSNFRHIVQIVIFDQSDWARRCDRVNSCVNDRIDTPAKNAAVHIVTRIDRASGMIGALIDALRQKKAGLLLPVKNFRSDVVDRVYAELGFAGMCGDTIAADYLSDRYAELCANVNQPPRSAYFEDDEARCLEFQSTLPRRDVAEFLFGEAPGRDRVLWQKQSREIMQGIIHAETSLPQLFRLGCLYGTAKFLVKAKYPFEDHVGALHTKSVTVTTDDRVEAA